MEMGSWISKQMFLILAEDDNFIMDERVIGIERLVDCSVLLVTNCNDAVRILRRRPVTTHYGGLMTKKLQLILFDMDNVLCRYDRSARIARLAELSGNTENEIHRRIWESGFERSGDEGTLSSSAYLQGFGRLIGYPLALEEWLDARRVSMKPDCAVLDVVRSLRDSAEVAVLTNNSELVADHIDVLFPELRSLFGQKIYASARFKTAKPDVACYRRCLSELRVGPEAVLFVDDLSENVAGAKQAGLHSHLFASVDALRELLGQYGF
jgi:HAD superfamily hydrolase (TIGR01509 family)